MKNLVILFILFISTSGYSQNLDEDFKLNLGLRLQTSLPVQFGEHSLSQAHQPKIGFGTSLNLFSFKAFNAGFGADFQKYMVTNDDMTGNFRSSNYSSFYGYLSYSFKTNFDVILSLDIAYGAVNVIQRTEERLFGEQNGNEYRFGLIADYLIGRKTAIFVGAHFIYSQLDMTTAPEYEDYFGKATQVQFALGIKF